MKRRDCPKMLVVHRPVAGEHVMDGRPCWCQPQKIRLVPHLSLPPRR